MNCHLLQDGVEFFQLQPVGSIPFIFCCYIPGCAGKAGCLMLSTFQDNLSSLVFLFLCHGFDPPLKFGAQNYIYKLNYPNGLGIFLSSIVICFNFEV